ncbi:MAG TPA: EAL domain-containing protein [Bryobacteraceae bacterium]|nr:EAL domain-containing protein [Bryobacteraceae bacterium]
MRRETEHQPTPLGLRFRRLLNSGIIGVFEGSESGQILDGNEAFLRMLGYSSDDLECGRIDWKQMTAPGHEEVSRNFLQQLLASGTTMPAEVEYLRKDGSRLSALVGLASIGGPDDVSEAIGFMFDLTRQRQAQEALRKSEEQFRQLAEHIQEVFWILDCAQTNIVYVSPAWEHVWGRSRETLNANPGEWPQSIHPRDRDDAVQVFRRQVRGEILTNQYRIVQPSGAVRWIRDRAFPIHDAAGHIIRIAGVAEDITEHKRSEIRLTRRAFYDELTGLPNRRLFRHRLRKAAAACESGKSGAVFFIDLDEFKLVNDSLGHIEGDRLLKEVARRLLAVCGDRGTLARFGGDEFMFVAADFEGNESVRDFAEKVIACLTEPFRLADRTVFIGAAIGISMFPEHSADPDTLKRNADIAMHEAKKAGKNRVMFFTPGSAEAALEKLELATRLRRALDSSEFKLEFQPQFPMDRSRPNRFEALIRWCPAGHSPIAPSTFIPIAEENGLIVPIGAWVLREACRRCAEWQTGTLGGVGVAVNVSAVQFACTDLVDIVRDALASAQLAPQLLELELTESVFLKDSAKSAAMLAKLRRLGVTIALDDFGTGYSSLSYLQNLPIDCLKIDRGFLLRAESQAQGESVLRCVVELAHALGIRVVGEGAETLLQLDLLRRLGCDEVQGFVLGMPSLQVEDASMAPDLARLNAVLRDAAPKSDIKCGGSFLPHAQHSRKYSVMSQT